MDSAELKRLLDEQATKFAAFKAENDKLIAQVEKTGSESATTRANVEKLNKQLDEVADKIAVADKAIEKLDVRLSAPRRGEQPADEQAEDNLAKLNALLDADKALTMEDYRQYKHAFNVYCRKGSATPHDVLDVLSVGTGSEGGFWCPPDTAGRLVQKVYELDPMRSLADVQPIGVDSLEGIIDNDEADAGWVAEQGTREDTDEPKIGKWSIPAHEMYAQPKTTQKLLDDAQFDVEGWLIRKGSSKFARVESAAHVVGTGSGQPRGFLDYTAVTTDDATRAWDNIQYVPTGAAGAFLPRASEVSPADVLYTAVGAMKDAYLAGAVWAMKTSTVTAIRKLKDGDGNYMWQPSLVAGQPSTLVGYSLVKMPSMPVIAANSLSIAFANFREAYQIVDRLGIRILRDPYTAKGYVKFYMTRRVGGGLVNGEAIKVIKFAAS